MGHEHAGVRARELDRRICNVNPPMPRDVADLYAQLKGALLAAVRSEHLLTPWHQVEALLKRTPNSSARGTAEGIVGGRKDFRRESDDGWFKRDDGGLFNFFVSVKAGTPMWLLAYNFELRLPKGAGAEFVRFDLNPPWETDRDEMRCHLHPGDEGLRAPSPLMSPLELLEQLLYGLRLPRRRRSSTP